MKATKYVEASDEEMRALAEFRFALRSFLHFSEEAASRAGLTAQQHQLMLQIAGAPEGTITTIGYLAERLSLKHNTVVELSTRGEEAGLVARRSDPANRRNVVVKLTARGNRILRRLSADHSRELNVLGPQLIRALKALIT